MTLIRRFMLLAITPLMMMRIAAAQSPSPALPDPNLQFVDNVMRTATAIHDLVRGMNLQKSFAAYPPGDPRANQRTAEFMGMGAGVGMALGEMSHNPKGAMIGAAAGAAGGLVADQILRHQAAKAQATQPPPDQIPTDPPARKLRERKEN
jgi:hypothetical protein